MKNSMQIKDKIEKRIVIFLLTNGIAVFKKYPVGVAFTVLYAFVKWMDAM